MRYCSTFSVTEYSHRSIGIAGIHVEERIGLNLTVVPLGFGSDQFLSILIRLYLRHFAEIALTETSSFGYFYCFMITVTILIVNTNYYACFQKLTV